MYLKTKVWWQEANNCIEGGPNQFANAARDLNDDLGMPAPSDKCRIKALWGFVCSRRVTVQSISRAYHFLQHASGQVYDSQQVVESGECRQHLQKAKIEFVASGVMMTASSATGRMRNKNTHELV